MQRYGKGAFHEIKIIKFIYKHICLTFIKIHNIFKMHMVNHDNLNISNNSVSPNVACESHNIPHISYAAILEPHIFQAVKYFEPLLSKAVTYFNPHISPLFYPQTLRTLIHLANKFAEYGLLL